MRETVARALLLALAVAGCTQAAQVPDVQAPVVPLQQPLPLVLSISFPDLTERLEWTISFPAGWTAEAVHPTGLGGRWIKEDPIGLTSASITFTTLNGSYTTRSVLDVVVGSLPRNGYADINVTAVNDLPPVMGAQALEVYLNALHSGTRIHAAWVVRTVDLTQSGPWPATALELWALEFPAGQAARKLPTLLAILRSARLSDTGIPVGETWYGKIAENWMDTLGNPTEE